VQWIHLAILIQYDIISSRDAYQFLLLKRMGYKISLKPLLAFYIFHYTVLNYYICLSSFSEQPHH
ncbi:hypothetical protein ACJX0J_024416, partial [Zea mays]